MVGASVFKCASPLARSRIGKWGAEGCSGSSSACCHEVRVPGKVEAISAFKMLLGLDTFFSVGVAFIDSTGGYVRAHQVSHPCSRQRPQARF